MALRKKRGDPKRNAYREQRNNAKRRGIAFEFSLESWLEWWGDDLQHRGRRSGQLVMARIGDVGAYEVGNVHKVTQTGNILESRQMTVEGRHEVGRRSREAHAARKASGGKHHWESQNTRRVRTALGLFDSVAAAAEAHRVARQTIWRWFKSGQAVALNPTPVQLARVRHAIAQDSAAAS